MLVGSIEAVMVYVNHNKSEGGGFVFFFLLLPEAVSS